MTNKWFMVALKGPALAGLAVVLVMAALPGSLTTAMAHPVEIAENENQLPTETTESSDSEMTATIQTQVLLTLDKTDAQNPVFTGSGDIYVSTADAYSRRYMIVKVPDTLTMITPVGERPVPDGTDVTFEGSLNARNGYENFRILNKSGAPQKADDNLYIGQLHVRVPLTRDFDEYGAGRYTMVIPVTLESHRAYGIYSDDLIFSSWAELVESGQITVSDGALTQIAQDGRILDIDPSVTSIAAPLQGLSYTEADIPSSVTGASGSPLCGSDVEKVVFGDGTAAVPEGMCAGAKSLVRVIMPDTIRTLGSRCFHGCTMLTQEGINLPDQVTLCTEAFAECTGISELHLRNGMLTDGMTIGYDRGDGPFRASGIETVIIDEGTLAVPGWICSGCDRVREIVFPSNDLMIADLAFSGMPELKELHIRSNITHESDGEGQWPCFSETGIEKIVFEDGVTSIPGLLVNEDSADLKEIYIPASVKELGEAAFGYEEGSYTVYYGGTEAEWEELNTDPETGFEKVMAQAVIFHG